MKKLVVVGGGPAGNAAALAAARRGVKDIVLVEKDTMGGTCTNRGCIPTKFFLSKTAAAGSDGQPPLDWARMVSHKNALTRGLARSIEQSCRKAGVEIINGHGRLSGGSSVEVEAPDGARKRIETETVILASGSAPAAIPGFSMDGKRVISSTEALQLEEIPRSIIIIGSGAVGSEFAFIFSSAGSRVTLVEGVDRLFPQEDREVHELFLNIYSKLGVEVIIGDPVISVNAADDGRSAAVTLRSGRKLEEELVLVGVGRTLLTDDLGLDRVSLELGSRGEIAVDEDLKTAHPRIFAAGDITGRLMLAHLAAFQGEQAALNAIGEDSRPVPYHAVPWTIFTNPEIATVGLNEDAAKAAGLDCAAAIIPWMDNVKARIDRNTEGFVKMVANRKTGAIVGGTVVGAHASDMIHIISAAIHRETTVSDIGGMIFAHPGLAETIFEVNTELLKKM